jgi:hypothetical protein
MLFMKQHKLDSQFIQEHGIFQTEGYALAAILPLRCIRDVGEDGKTHFNIAVYVPYSYRWDDETMVSSEPINFPTNNNASN